MKRPSAKEEPKAGPPKVEASWAGPAEANSKKPVKELLNRGQAPNAEQTSAQSGGSSQGCPEQFRPPAPIPMRQIQPADKPESSRTKPSGSGSSRAERTRSGGGTVKEIRLTVTPPGPEFRFLVQELTEMKFVQMGTIPGRTCVEGSPGLSSRQDFSDKIEA